MFVTFSQYIRYQRVRRNVWSDLCLRFCFHYEILNSKTRNIAYMVPRFDDVNNTLFFQNIPDLIKALGIGKMQKVLFWWKHWTRREINEAAYADHTTLFITDQEISTETQMFCLGNLVYFLILLKPIVIYSLYMFSSRDLT